MREAVEVDRRDHGGADRCGELLNGAQGAARSPGLIWFDLADGDVVDAGDAQAHAHTEDEHSGREHPDAGTALMTSGEPQREGGVSGRQSEGLLKVQGDNEREPAPVPGSATEPDA